MPDIEAARLVYGVPTKGQDAVLKMEDWLDKHCRDWRYDSGAVQGVGRWRPITVSAVFEDPQDRSKLANLVAQQVKRWGFERAASADNVVAMTVDVYADGPLGDKMKYKVLEVMEGIRERNRLQRHERLKAFARKLAKVHEAAEERRVRVALQKLRDGVAEVKRAAKRRRVAQDS